MYLALHGGETPRVLSEVSLFGSFGICINPSSKGGVCYIKMPEQTFPYSLSNRVFVCFAGYLASCTRAPPVDDENGPTVRSVSLSKDVSRACRRTPAGVECRPVGEEAFFSRLSAASSSLLAGRSVPCGGVHFHFHRQRCFPPGVPSRNALELLYDDQRFASYSIDFDSFPLVV